MALLSLMLLGLDAMEWSALRTSRATYFFSVAANQLHTMQGRLLMRVPYPSSDALLASWNLENQTVLPNGKGSLKNTTLTIWWGDAKPNPCELKSEGLAGCLQTTVA